MSEFETGSVDTGNPVADAAGAPATNTQETWYSGLPEETRGMVEIKGWKGPEDAIQSYANLEKMLGADKAGRGLVITPV